MNQQQLQLLRNEKFSLFMDRLMNLPSHEISYAEGFKMMNDSASMRQTTKHCYVNHESCHTFILETIPNMIAEKYVHLISSEKLENMWAMMNYVSRISGISYETFSSRCREVILQKFMIKNRTIPSSILRRQMIGNYCR